MTKLNKSEDKVLRLLAGENYGMLYFVRGIVDETGLTTTQAKRAARSLVRKGLAKLSAAFNEDDGLLMGRGYGCTLAGREAAKGQEARGVAA